VSAVVIVAPLAVAGEQPLLQGLRPHSHIRLCIVWHRLAPL